MALNLKANGPYHFALRETVDPAFQYHSTDFMLSHAPEYIALGNKPRVGRKAGKWARLLHVYHEGRCVLALPLHSQGPMGFTTGYSGFLLPSGVRESAIRVAFAGLQVFLKQNRNKRFELQQAVWRGSASDPRREAMVLRSFAEHFRPELMPCRVLELSTGAVLGEDALLKLYDGKVRNQIRHAKTEGLQITVAALKGEEALQTMRQLIAELHPAMHLARRSTGMRTRQLDMMVEEFSAYLTAGGTVICSAARADGQCISANLFVLHQGAALYHTAFCLDDYKKANVMPLLMHRNILCAAEHGAQLVELGRVVTYDPKSLALDAYKAQFANTIRFALQVRFGWIWIPDWIVHSFGRLI